MRAPWIHLLPKSALPKGARASALGVLAILLCSSCERPTARLLEIDAVQRDDDGRALSVSGHGFPGSHAGLAELRGTLYRPGEGPRPLSLQLACHALSEELLRVDLDSSDEPELSGIFEGKVEIRFRSSAGDSEVVGAISDVRLRLEPHLDEEPARALGLVRRARAFHRSLGALELEATPRGLVLSSLSKDSVLEQAGLSPGDRIERIDGAPVERVVDLLPRDEHSGHLLDVVKRRGGTKLQVEVGTLERRSPLGSDLGLLCFVVAGLGGLLIAPRAKATSARSGPSLRYGVPGLTCVSFLCATGLGGPLDLRVFVGIPFVALVGCLAFAFARRRVTSERALNHVVQLSATGLALASLTILSGNLTIAWFGTSDAAYPSQWPLLAAPPAWLALLVIAGSTPAHTGEKTASMLVGWGRLTVLAAVVALSAGAGNAPSISNLTVSWLVGALLLTAKTALLHVLTQSLTLRPRPSLLVALALFAPLSSWLFMLWPKASELTLPLGALGLGFWLVQSLRSQLSAPLRPARDPALAPFL